MLKGFRTLILNALLAGSVPVLDVLLQFNWVEAVGPTVAIFIMAGLNGVMRLVTTTPVGQSE